MKNIVIFDIDATLADNQWRVLLYPKFNNGDRVDMKKYVALSPKDPPIESIVMICQFFLANPKYKIYFMTGRHEAERKVTLEWLQQKVWFAIRSEQLFMRPDNVYSETIDDGVMKLNWAKQITENDLSKVLCVFEDRNFVVKAWRDNGIFCIQPQDGDF